MADDIRSKLLAGVNTKNTVAEGPQPFGDFERLVVQNLFDTQPARRKSFMKRLGYELNPEDDNEYRPIGSDADFQEIDPGVHAYFAKGGLKELGKDIADLGFDAGIAAPATAGGAALGAKGGAALGAAGGAAAGLAGGPAAPVTSTAGAGAGAAIMGTAGAIAGGAAGNATAEVFKKKMGDLFLNEDIPLDKGALAMQSMLSGAAPLLAKGAQKATGNFIARRLAKQADALTDYAKKGGVNMSKELIEDITAHPEKWSKEALSKVEGEFDGVYKTLFGMTDDQLEKTLEKGVSSSQIEELLRKNPDSAFGKKLRELGQQRDLAFTILDRTPETGFTKEEFVAPLERKLGELTRLDRAQKSPETDAAIKWLTDKISAVEEDAAKSGGRIPFSYARKTLSSFQEQAASLPEGVGNQVKRAIGSGEDQLRKLVDTKAGEATTALRSAGAEVPDLLDVNKQYGKVLGFFENPQKLSKLKKSSIINGAYSKDKDLGKVLSEVDEITGSQLAPALESGGVRTFISRQLDAANPRQGSQAYNAMKDAIRADSKAPLLGQAVGGTIGGAMGSPLGAGGAAGGTSLGMGLGRMVGGEVADRRSADLASKLVNPAEAAQMIAGKRAQAAVAQEFAQPAQNFLRDSAAAFSAVGPRAFLEGEGQSPVRKPDLRSRLLEGLEEDQ